MKKVLLWVLGIFLVLGVIGALLPDEEEAADEAVASAPVEPKTEEQVDEPKTTPERDKPKTCADRGPADETAGELLERCDPGSAIPEPTDRQAQALVASLATIEPSLADEFDGTVDNARNQCTSVLSGSETLVASTVDRFAYDAGYDYDGANQMPESVALDILAVIEAEPWCT